MASKRSGKTYDKKPLYRKVNTTTHGVYHNSRGAFSDTRKSKKNRNIGVANGPMNAKNKNGLDYTPLFKFLLSKVGQDWDAVYSEAVGRLDRSEPIFWMVARNDLEKKSILVAGESTYFSGLYIDDMNQLAIVDPSVSANNLKPFCSCCTHTLNGQPFVCKTPDENPEMPSLSKFF